jgi:hypothetical protein
MKTNLLESVDDRRVFYCAVILNDRDVNQYKADVGKHSLLNRTSKSWKQLTTGFLASFPCKLNTFRKKVKNVVTSKGIQVGVECK